MKSKFTEKVTSGKLKDEIEYCRKLIKVVKNNDTDAKVGHKSADSSFFGYKTHIAMTEERIIITAVEKNMMENN